VNADVCVFALVPVPTTFVLRVFESRDDHLEPVQVRSPRVSYVTQRQEVGLRVHGAAAADVGDGFVTRDFYLQTKLYGIERKQK
jgi:hypothetical protein